MMRSGSSRSLAALRHLAVGELGARGGEALRRPPVLWRRVAALLLRRDAERTPAPQPHGPSRRECGTTSHGGCEGQ